MNYKELIKRLKYYGNTYAIGDNLGREVDGTDKIILKATDAIETLLMERDAAVKDLTSICEESGDSCHLCKHFPCAPEHDKCIGFEWRSPQKGEAHGSE